MRARATAAARMRVSCRDSFRQHDSFSVLLSDFAKTWGVSMKTLACLGALALAATTALAHHSNSAFDPDKVVVLKGTVTQWKWTNPHVWIFLSVDDGKGGKVEWEIEGRPPGVLSRAGWSRTIFKVGDT